MFYGPRPTTKRYTAATATAVQQHQVRCPNWTRGAIFKLALITTLRPRRKRNSEMPQTKTHNKNTTFGIVKKMRRVRDGCTKVSELQQKFFHSKSVFILIKLRSGVSVFREA
jgi:hypothetical protein